MGTPFNPTHPFDRAAESARKRVTAAMIEIAESSEMSDLPASEALIATIAGSLTGVVGALLLHVQPTSRDHLMAVIEGCLPKARTQAESMLEAHRHGN